MAKTCVAYGPGDQVTLPVGEIEKLRALGFLVDPTSRVRATRALILSGGGE